MKRSRKLERKSMFLDSATLKRARRALGASSDAEAVRASLERVAEMDEYWRFMERTKASLKPGEFERP